ncbi:MAG: putative baseplate assembly protein, partial [Nitriliruptorales bacterium]|nr:putative baseplate assembly protein [Nitriliruptorales bacterium]
MTLPAPNLDDRRFQGLVDDAKRMVQQRCPEWTDHNVSDPGVTLIELFAWMADQLIYRMNRVPERNYVKFLDLLGLRLYPATAARADVTFWLAGPIEEPVRIPRGTRVATRVTELEDAIHFMSVRELEIPPCELISVKVSTADGGPYDHSDILKGAAPFSAFSDAPEVGDNLLLGLSDPVPSCAIEFRFDCNIEGVGVDPEDPPLAWEAWTGEEWVRCDVESDETGGLNEEGAVVIHLPEDHTASVIEGQRAGWVRCRALEPEDDQPGYTASPIIVSVAAQTVGGTAPTVNAQEITDEVVGLSEGVPAQRFELEHHPVVAGDGLLELETASGSGWETWTQVDNFAEFSSSDRVFVLDEHSGELVFGPAVREPDGTVTQYGAVPPKGSPIRVPRYRTGGGSGGNVAARSITQLTTGIPFVSSVSNRRSASGGVDAEPLEDAKERGPILLRTRNRAVTTEDYEHLAREVAPEVARVRCVPVEQGSEPGTARVLVVPAVTGSEGDLEFGDLVPAEPTLARITAHLE